MKKLVWTCIGLVTLVGLLTAQNSGTPSTLRVKTDAIGNLISSLTLQTLPYSQPTIFSNIRLKTDANGNLLIANNGVFPVNQYVAANSVSNWKTTAAPSTNRFNDVIWSNRTQQFVAVGQAGTINNEVMTSPDGFTWTNRTAAADASWTAIAESPTRFVAVASGTNANYSMYSTDGITWTLGGTSGFTTNGGSIAWDSGLSLFVAISITTGTQSILTSPDGTAWTLRTHASTAPRYVTYSPELNLLVVGITSTTGIFTSTDAVTWTQRTVPTSPGTWGSGGIEWSSELHKFVATSSTGGAANVIYSSDGINWFAGSTPSNGNFKVKWSAELQLFEAVGNAHSMSSFDGITWTDRTITSGVHTSLAWAPPLHEFVSTTTAGSTVSYTQSPTITNGSQIVNASTAYYINGALFESVTAPTIASGGCTSPAVTSNNGTAAFLLTTGSSCTGIKTFVLTMPASSHFWHVSCDNNTSDAQQQTNYLIGRATSTTAVTLTSYDRVTGLQEDLTASDTYLCNATAE